MICPKCKKDLGQINPQEQGRCPYCNYDLRSYDPYAPNKTSDPPPHKDYEPPAPNPSGTSSESLSGGVGDSITGLGNAICVVGIIASVIIGGSIVSKDDDLFLIGLLIIGLGCFLSWLSTLLLRGFGQLVSDTAIIRQLLQNRK